MAVIRDVTPAGNRYQGLGRSGHCSGGGVGTLHKEKLDLTLHTDTEEFKRFEYMQLDLKKKQLTRFP